jgi:2-iminoacetate synthase ThiH
MAHHQVWSPEDVQRLQQMVDDGFTTHSIARHFKRTLPSINQQIVRLRQQGRLPYVKTRQSPVAGLDYTTQAGAERLAAKVRDYWEAAGRRVEVWVEAGGAADAGFVVRSDLKFEVRR